MLGKSKFEELVKELEAVKAELKQEKDKRLILKTRQLKKKQKRQTFRMNRKTKCSSYSIP